jgi:hypothetical protein
MPLEVLLPLGGELPLEEVQPFEEELPPGQEQGLLGQGLPGET